MLATFGVLLLAISAGCASAQSSKAESTCAEYLHTWADANETVHVSMDGHNYLIAVRNGDGSAKGTYVATCSNNKLGNLPSTLGDISLIKGGTAIAWAGEELVQTTEVVLQFRPVAAGPEPVTVPDTGTTQTTSDAVTPGAPAETLQQAETQFTSLTCGAGRARVDRPDEYLATCSQDGTVKYLLGPSILDGTGVTGARASTAPSTGEWIVLVTFNSTAQRSWTQYTGAHVGDEIAITVDGRVLSAPRINGAVNGPTSITGSFTETAARKLARELGGR